MPTVPHLAAFQRNLGDVTRLLELHSLVAGGVSGRASALQVLNRSAIVLLVACWEAYVEDLAVAAFDWMLTDCLDPDSFPKKVRARASRAVRESKDELAVWALADGGWKNILQQHRDDTIQNNVAIFNTPKAERIDSLYSNLIGLPKLSSHWRWSGTSSESVRSKLEKLLAIRGDIAHRVRQTGLVKRPEVDDFVAFTHRLSVRSHNAVVAHLIDTTSKSPWAHVEYVAIDMGSPAERRKRVKRSWGNRK